MVLLWRRLSLRRGLFIPGAPLAPSVSPLAGRVRAGEERPRWFTDVVPDGRKTRELTINPGDETLFFFSS